MRGLARGVIEDRVSILSTIIAPQRVDEFLATTWGKRAKLYSSESRERLAFFETLLGKLELRELLGLSRGPVAAWYLDDGVPDFSLRVGVEHAYQLFRAGLTIYFDLDADTGADAIVKEVCDELGHRSTAKVSVLATRAGGRTVVHVDGNESLTVQLSGRKRWYVRDSSSTREIEDWQPAPAPPDEVVELGPGDAFYCPPTWLHAVDCLEDSLSLNFSINPISWAALLAPTIAAALQRDPAWRERVPSVTAASSADATSHAAKLLGTLGLVHAADRLFAEVPAGPVSANTVLRRDPTCHCRIDSVELDTGASDRVRLRLSSPRGERIVIADPTVFAVCRAIAARGTASFRASDLEGVSPDDAVSAIERLIAAGFIAPVATTT